MIEFLTNPQNWASFLTLSALEIVLGIDNLIFISIMVGRLPLNRQPAARRVGLGLALISRVAFLGSIVWIASLTKPLFTIMGFSISARDLILGLGGLFLLAKSTMEIHESLEGEVGDKNRLKVKVSFLSIVLQIMVLDIVFSIDSVITAVGMAQELSIMIAAVVVAIGVMLFASAPVGAFVDRHPTVKMLALSFLLLVGVALVGDSLHFHIPRGYLYFAIAFSALVETFNLVAAHRHRQKAVQLRPHPHKE